MRPSSFIVFIVFVVAALSIPSVNGYAFMATRLSYGSIQSGSDFVVRQRPNKVSIVRPQQKLQRHNAIQMGSQAKFGIFSPAVYVAKLVLGDKKLNSIRGKAISLHSQAIGEFCEWAGAYHLRTRLIKKAKTNGDSLGFLVWERALWFMRTPLLQLNVLQRKRCCSVILWFRHQQGLIIVYSNTENGSFDPIEC